jgi:hypothetical protein
MRLARLKVKIFPNWQHVSTGNSNYIRNGNKKNTIKITYAFYKGGTIPNPSGQDLIELSKNVAINERFQSFFQESGCWGLSIFLCKLF